MLRLVDMIVTGEIGTCWTVARYLFFAAIGEEDLADHLKIPQKWQKTGFLKILNVVNYRTYAYVDIGAYPKRIAK